MDRLRSATTDDALALGRIHLAAATVAYADIFPAESPPPTIEQLAGEWADLIAQSGSTVLVACIGGSQAGAVAVHPDGSMPTGWALARLYVHPQHWGQGLGGRLHDSVLQRLAAVEGGPDAVNLWVLEANHRARAFYQARGWALVPGRYLANNPPHVRDVLYRLAVGGVATMFETPQPNP